MGSTGGLELERDPIPLLIKPVKCLFIIEGRDLLVLKFLSPSRGNEEKDMMGHCTEIDCETENLGIRWRLALVMVVLIWNSRPPLFSISIPRRDPSKAPFHLSKGIVGLCIRAVEADADPLNP